MHPYHDLHRPAAVVDWCRRKPEVEEDVPNCPRCDSSNTKFCYYNNYNLRQPRYLCKGCRRYWTMGGSLRNVPVGGRRRKRRPGKPTTTSSIEPATSGVHRRSSSSSGPTRPGANMVDMTGSWGPFQRAAVDSSNNADSVNGVAVRQADVRPPALEDMSVVNHHVDRAMDYSVGSWSNFDEQLQFQFHPSEEIFFFLEQRIVEVDDQLRNMRCQQTADLCSSFKSEVMAMHQGNYFQCMRLSAPSLMPELAEYAQVFDGGPTHNNIMPWTARTSFNGL